MPANPARAHTHLSNRAKVRSALERRSVYKSVLENPFQISWPSIAVNIQNAILARLVATLENIPPRPHAPKKISRRMSTGHQENMDIAGELANSNIPTDSSAPHAGSSISGASSCIVIGINTVTRALESQLRFTRKRVILDDGQQQNGDQLPPRLESPPILVVFVCCADVDPTALIDHIPYLVAGCNSPRNATKPVKLVPLPKGSERLISQILGVRRAAAVAFRSGLPLVGTLDDILDAVPVVSAPWLCPSGTRDVTQLVPTHIKQLRTTVPKDMKAAKEQRAKAKAAAKERPSSSSRPIRRKPRVTLTLAFEAESSV